MSWRTTGTNNYQNAESLVQCALGTRQARTKTHQDLIDDTSRVTSQVSRKPDTLLPEMDRTVSERLPRMAAGNKKTTL